MNVRLIPSLLLLTLFVVGAAGRLDAQAFDRYEGRLSAETVQRLNAIAERAERSGVPPELLRRKVNEGVAKGVTGGRLERAIEDYAARLAAASDLAGSGSAPEVLEAAAEAADRGVAPDRIRRFLRANPNARRSVVGLRVLGDLQELGVPAGEASRAVNAALDRGWRGERMLALSAAVRRRIGAGEDPSAAVRAEVDEGRGGGSARRPN